MNFFYEIIRFIYFLEDGIWWFILYGISRSVDVLITEMCTQEQLDIIET